MLINGIVLKIEEAESKLIESRRQVMVLNQLCFNANSPYFLDFKQLLWLGEDNWPNFMVSVYILAQLVVV